MDARIAQGAVYGLTPDQVWDYTEREFDLYVHGRQVHEDRMLDTFAWMQANLMNIHIPKGKGKMNVRRLRAGANKRAEGVLDDVQKLSEAVKLPNRPQLGVVEAGDRDGAKKELATYKVRMRAYLAAQEDVEFWQGEEGRMLAQRLDEYDSDDAVILTGDEDGEMQ